MRIEDGLSQAVRPLVVYKLRSALSILGILIGVMAIITLILVMRSVASNISTRVQGLGSNLVVVTMNPLVRASNGYGDLTIGQAERLGHLRGFASAAGADFEDTTIRHGTSGAAVTVYAADPTLTHVLQYHLARGRLIRSDDVRYARHVVVLGSQTSRQLFGRQDPLGRHVSINGGSYRVVGVLAPKGAFFDVNQDAVAVMPLSTYEETSGIRSVDVLYLTARGEAPSAAALHRLNRALEKDIGSEGSGRYTVMTQSEILSVTHHVGSLLTKVLLGVAAISIVVGGVGMFNVLLMSVSERVREIGIRKSLGARRLEILLQFLLEAVLTAAVGAGLGTIGGIGASMAMTRAMDVDLRLDPWVPLAALAGSVIFGILCGIYPAWRAARLAPAEALRHH